MTEHVYRLTELYLPGEGDLQYKRDLKDYLQRQIRGASEFLSLTEQEN